MKAESRLIERGLDIREKEPQIAPTMSYRVELNVTLRNYLTMTRDAGPSWRGSPATIHVLWYVLERHEVLECGRMTMTLGVRSSSDRLAAKTRYMETRNVTCKSCAAEVAKRPYIR